MFVKYTYSAILSSLLLSPIIASPLSYITDIRSMDPGARIFTEQTKSTHAVVTTPDFLNSLIRYSARVSHQHDAAIIDLREKVVYERSHIHDAISIPVANDGKQVTFVKSEVAEEVAEMEHMDRKKFIVFVCDEGKLRSANIAAAYYNHIKDEKRFEQQTVVLLMGGFNAAVRYNAANEQGLNIDTRSIISQRSPEASTDDREYERQLIEAEDLVY